MSGSPSRWAICLRCDAQVDLTYWIAGHARFCFPTEFLVNPTAATTKYYRRQKAQDEAVAA